MTVSRHAAYAAALACAALPARGQDAAPAPTFEIQAYDVSGNTLLDQNAVDRAVYPHLGPGKTVDDVERARAALEGEYKRRGFEAVSVAIAGTEGDNVVKLQVVETRIARLTVTGDKYFSEERILRQLPSLRRGESPNLARAQRELSRLDRNPDRRITPRITPGQEPGTIDVALEVDETFPYHASVTLTNDHSPNTSDLRLFAQGRATNFLGLGHTVSFTYVVAPERRKDAEVYSASYLAPIGLSPWSILVYGYTSNSDVAVLGGANVLGDGYAIGVRGILALPSFGSWSHSVNFGADFKDFNENTQVADADAIAAPVTYVSPAVTYSIQRAGALSTVNVALGATAGTRAFNDRISPGNDPFTGRPLPTEAVFNNRRVGARENFVHVNLDADYTRALPGDASVVVRLAAQYSNGPLISNEQFSLGGLTSVRGYLQSEAVVDDGVSGNIELRSPSLDLFGALRELRAYGFVDGGFGRQRQVLRPRTDEGLILIDPNTGAPFDPTQQADFALASVGIGARLQVLRYLSGDAVLALPLISSQAPQFRSSAYTQEGDATFQFSVKGEF